MKEIEEKLAKKKVGKIQEKGKTYEQKVKRTTQRKRNKHEKSEENREKI
jgi:hypothetical protein